MREKSLIDIFGPNASEEAKEITRKAAEQSMDDMAKVINSAMKRKKSLSDFFGDNLTPEIQAELNTIGENVAEYLGYVAKFKPNTEQQYPLNITEYYNQKDA